MNALNIMQLITPQSNTNMPTYSRDTGNENSAFLQILGNSMMNVDQENQDLRINSDSKDEIFTLYKEIVALIEQLPKAEQSLNKEALTSPAVEQLLEELPLPIRMDIEELFETEKPLSDLTKSEDILFDGIKLLAIAIHFTELVDNESTDLAQPFHDQLQKLMSMVFHSSSVEKSEDEQVKQNNGFGFINSITSFQSNTSKENVQTKEHQSNQSQRLIQSITASLQAMSQADKEKLGDRIQALKNSNNIKGEAAILSAFTRVVSDQSPKAEGVVMPNPLGNHLNHTQQFVLHVGENRSGQPNQEQFFRQFQNILGRSTLTQFPNGLNQLTIKLFPEHLGRLDVKLTQQNGVIIAKLMTTTQAAKGAIEAQIHQLKQAFVAQNIQVEKIEVVSQQQQTLNQSDKQNQEEKSSREEPNREPQQQDESEEEVNFKDLLEETFSTTV